MGDNEFKVRMLLSRDFAVSGACPSGKGGMPAPRSPLFMTEEMPLNAPTVELMPGLLSHYPLRLTDILMREKLRAHFDFYCTDRAFPLVTCFDREQLDIRERELISFADEPVSGWNLIQIRVAKSFIDNAPKNGRAVSLKTLQAFEQSPQQFYAALAEQRAPSLH